MTARRTIGKSGTLLAAALLLWPACTASLAKTYKGAEYRTKEAFLYGRFETRSKAIGREGTLSSFFTYNDDFPATPWNEIDIEILGRYTDDVQFNTITPGQQNHVSHHFVRFNPALDYHVYAFEWTPDYVAWFVDSVEVYRQTGAHIATLTRPQKLMMNVWIPAYPSWVGPWNEATLPAFAYYDWIRYASYTPGAGSVGTGKNFTPQWTDPCDSWDQTRWDKASHTWAENNCDFVPENVVFRDGALVLCLTRTSPLGYTDTAPPTVFNVRAEADSLRVRFSEEVDSASSCTATNYLVPGLTVAGARLLDDLRTIMLGVPGLSASTVSAMLIQNIRDRWPTPNAMTSTGFRILRATPLALPVRINVGGGAQGVYLADRAWSDSVEYGSLDGQSNTFPGAEIAGTTEDEVFRSELFGLCEYKVRVPNGRYTVRLMLAENYFTSAGQRLMNIVVEGQDAATLLDLAGSVGYRTAFTPETTVDVTDGRVDIHMQALLNQPLLNGIVVSGVGTEVNENFPPAASPDGWTVLPNYPNPFNGSTRISFSVPAEEGVTLRIFDTLGREVGSKPLGVLSRGPATTTWGPEESGGLSSGMYYYCLEGISRSAFRKLVYVK